MELAVAPAIPAVSPAGRPLRRQSDAGLALLALGVVYGDIGTSPLYAAKETFNPVHGIALNSANVIGGVSAIFWALMIVVSLKYVILIMSFSGIAPDHHEAVAEQAGGNPAN